jgi:hypothetical protein
VAVALQLPLPTLVITVWAPAGATFNKSAPRVRRREGRRKRCACNMSDIS